MSEVFSVLWLADANTAELIVAKVTEKSIAEEGIDVADEWVEYIVHAVKSAEQRRWERMKALEREEERKRKAAHEVLVAEAEMRCKVRSDAHEERLARGRAVVEQRKEKGKERARLKSERDLEWAKKMAERNERDKLYKKSTGVPDSVEVSNIGAEGVGVGEAQGQGEGKDEVEEEIIEGNRFTGGEGLIIEKKKRKRFVSRAKGDLREKRRELKRAEMLQQETGNQIENEQQTQTLPRNGATEWRKSQ